MARACGRWDALRARPGSLAWKRYRRAPRHFTDVQRFKWRMGPTTRRGCRLWHGALDEGGYGTFTLHGRMISAHRAAFTLFVGPIPTGYAVDHLCNVRRCVNPAHLEAVTPRENAQRAVKHRLARLYGPQRPI